MTSLVQIIACRLFATKPLSEPMQCLNIVIWTLGDKPKWNFIWSLKLSIKKMHLKMSSAKAVPFCRTLLHTSQRWSLRWRHIGRESVSNHQPHDCLLNRLFRRRSKKTSKIRVTGLCAGNSPVTGECPAQMASNAENASIWWSHHAMEMAVISGKHVISPPHCCVIGCLLGGVSTLDKNGRQILSRALGGFDTKTYYLISRTSNHDMLWEWVT